MYRKRDGTRDTGCRGGRRSVDEDDDKDEDVSGQGGCQPGRRRRDYVGEEPKRQSATPRWGRGGQPHHRGRGGQLGHQGRERGGRWADLSSPFAWGNQRRSRRGRPSHCTSLPWQCLTRGPFVL
jgi:hypothetical protein